MPESASSHPTKESLAAFASGEVDDESLGTIQAHLAECPSCCAFLKALPPDVMVNLLRESTALPEPAGDSIGQEYSQELPPGLWKHPRYLVLEMVGAGGMGTVYRAEHRLMKRTVALKVIHQRLMARPSAGVRFRREVEAVARLAHPNIAAAYDAGQVAGTHFLVMEFVEGTDLASLVKTSGPLKVAQACDYVRQAALALQHAHERGLVHRDIKPHNLMLTPEGTIKVLDFGIASLLDEPADEVAADPRAVTVPEGALTDVGDGMGTPEYVAPEQRRDAHSADIRADIYSLGCTLAFLLTGRPQGTAAPDLPADLPPHLKAIIQRMTASDPADRYAEPSAVAEALMPFTRRAWPETAAARRRWRWRALLIAAVLVVAGLGAWVAAKWMRTPTRIDIFLRFDEAVPETIADKHGRGTGFTRRLPGSGLAFGAKDENLELFDGIPELRLRSTRVDLDVKSKLPKGDLRELEAPGFFLENIGNRDLLIAAHFVDVRVPDGSDQLMIYAGTPLVLVRAGFHYHHRYFIVLNREGNDVDRPGETDPDSFEEGDEITLELRRTAGRWTLSWMNETHPNRGVIGGVSLPWLDEEKSLYVGVLYANAGNDIPKIAHIKWFKVQSPPKDDH